MTNKVGIYPGTFDPITLGHLDIVKRSERLVDKLIFGIAEHSGPSKSHLFSTEERVEMAKADIEALNLKIEVEVTAFDSLLMHYAVERDASVIIRGLRAVADFDYEFQMTGMNYHLNPDIQTIFLMSQDKYQFISSRFVKEVGRLGGDVSKFVTPATLDALHGKFRKSA